MLRLMRGWRGAVAVIAAIAALAVGVPLAAMASSSPTTYYACVTSKTGAIKIVSQSVKCAAGQHKISWNSAGPRGPAGPPGVATGYAAQSTSVIGLSTSLATVLTISLPRGRFIVNVQVNAYVRVGAVDWIFCAVHDAANVEVTWGRVTASGVSQTLAMTGVTRAGGAVKLGCLYAPVSGSGAPTAYGTFITAVPVQTVKA